MLHIYDNIDLCIVVSEHLRIDHIPNYVLNMPESVVFHMQQEE